MNKSKEVLKCWIIIAIISSIRLLYEIMEIGIDTNKIITSLLVIWLPLILNYIIHNKVKYSEYIILLGYLVNYAIVAFTSQTQLSWLYIIPMILSLIIYNNASILLICSLCTIIINIIQIYYRYSNFIYFDYTNYDIVVQIEILLSTIIILIIINNNFKYNSIEDIEDDEIFKDNITDTYNKYYLNQIIEDSETKKSLISIGIIDIDNFNYLNEKYSYRFGDLVLKHVAFELQEELKNNKVKLIRKEKDEFVLVSNSLDKNKLREILDKCKDRLSNTPISFGEASINIKTSTGLASSENNSGVKYNKLYIEAYAELCKEKLDKGLRH